MDPANLTPTTVQDVRTRRHYTTASDIRRPRKLKDSPPSDGIVEPLLDCDVNGNIDALRDSSHMRHTLMQMHRFGEPYIGSGQVSSSGCSPSFRDRDRVKFGGRHESDATSQSHTFLDFPEVKNCCIARSIVV